MGQDPFPRSTGWGSQLNNVSIPLRKWVRLGQDPFPMGQDPFPRSTGYNLGHLLPNRFQSVQFVRKNSLYQVFNVETPLLHDPIAPCLIRSELIKVQRLFFNFDETVPT